MSTGMLLVELFTEELPPKALKTLGEAFAATLRDGLAAREFLDRGSELAWYATPRRLAARITKVRGKSPDQPRERALVPANVGFDASGQPTPALLKKLEALGASAADLDKVKRTQDGRIEKLFLVDVASGQPLPNGVQAALEEAIERLPIPKIMTYQLDDGLTTVKFVRPAHGLAVLWGGERLPVTALGLESGRTTHGHRFLGSADIDLAHAGEYEDRLEREGKVIASFAKRRAAIEAQLKAKAAELNAVLDHDDALLDEVTALVEWPVVYVASFEREFLAVPQECLILTMRTNQKYFPLFDARGKLTEKFLVVSNMEAADPANIVDGNRRVVRPRLADARFFYDTDRKERLAARVPRLAGVVYHNKLGSQLQRVQRIQKLAGEIAAMLHADQAAAERAAWLAKADLVTGMVGEFPELQGIMGRYYALHDGEPPAVADAIEQHYWPRFANDRLPEGNVAAAVALADKLETLVGIFGIGLQPTGDKDPYALRRAAVGVLRILSERALPLDLPRLLQIAHNQFPRETVADSVTVDVYEFMLERLRQVLRGQGYGVDEVEAVVSQRPARIDLVVPRLAAVRAFRKLPEAESLAAANKRIQNILKKADAAAAEPDMSLMQEAAEKNLFAATARLDPVVDSLLENGDYTDALCALAQVRGEVDAFFDQVMVMTDEPLIRANRLALLTRLSRMMNQVADIAKLAS
ncbi:MAG: glycine--tRNA ligase subunit beta [Pseudomonadota bacterium]